jgi:hypothetical protein
VIAKAVERANERLEEAGEQLALDIYAHATRREPGENDRLRRW